MCLEISLHTNDHYYLLEHNGWYFAYKRFRSGLRPYYYYRGSYKKTTDMFGNTWYSSPQVTQQELAISGSISIRCLNAKDQLYDMAIPAQTVTIQVAGVHCKQISSTRIGAKPQTASDPRRIIKFRFEDIEYLGSYGDIVVRKFMPATEEETTKVMAQVAAILQRKSKDTL